MAMESGLDMNINELTYELPNIQSPTCPIAKDLVLEDTKTDLVLEDTKTFIYRLVFFLQKGMYF